MSKPLPLSTFLSTYRSTETFQVQSESCWDPPEAVSQGRFPIWGAHPGCAVEGVLGLCVARGGRSQGSGPGDRGLN